MLKDFLMKQILKRQLRGVSKEEQEKALTMIQKNPDLFKKIAEEIQAEMKTGKDQMQATLSITQKYQEELKKIM